MQHSGVVIQQRRDIPEDMLVSLHPYIPNLENLSIDLLNLLAVADFMNLEPVLSHRKSLVPASPL